MVQAASAVGIGQAAEHSGSGLQVVEAFAHGLMAQNS